MLVAVNLDNAEVRQFHQTLQTVSQALQLLQASQYLCIQPIVL